MSCQPQLSLEEIGNVKAFVEMGLIQQDTGKQIRQPRNVLFHVLCKGKLCCTETFFNRSRKLSAEDLQRLHCKARQTCKSSKYLKSIFRLEISTRTVPWDLCFSLFSNCKAVAWSFFWSRIIRKELLNLAIYYAEKIFKYCSNVVFSDNEWLLWMDPVTTGTTKIILTMNILQSISVKVVNPDY